MPRRLLPRLPRKGSIWRRSHLEKDGSSYTRRRESNQAHGCIGTDLQRFLDCGPAGSHLQQCPHGIELSSFNVVADEYYIPSRHPTCKNFRTGSLMIIAPWLLPAQSDVACEVGAGKSIVAELLLTSGRSLNRLLLTDESARTLEYSRQFEAAGATLKVSGAD